MKKIFLFTFILFIVSYQANAKKQFTSNKRVVFQDTTLNYLKSLDFSKYIGKPVDSFLAVLPANFIDRRIAGWGNFYYARVLFVRYADSSLLTIYVKNFTHMQQYSATMAWDISLFKKETVYCISLSKKGEGRIKPNEECDPYE